MRNSRHSVGKTAMEEVLEAFQMTADIEIKLASSAMKNVLRDTRDGDLTVTKSVLKVGEMMVSSVD